MSWSFTTIQPISDFPPLSETLNPIPSNPSNIPVEVWDDIISLLDHDNDRHLQPLSLVNTYLLYITNRHKQTLKISDPTSDFLPSLFRRFPNLKHLSLADFSGDPIPILLHLANSDIRLETLDLSNQCRLPFEALRLLNPSILSGVKSLNISWLPTLSHDDLSMIPSFFPDLEELDLSLPSIQYACDDDDDDRRQRWNSRQFLRREVTDRGVFVLAKKLKGLRRINLEGNELISAKGIISLSKNRPDLEEIRVEISQPIYCAPSLSRIDFRHADVSDSLLMAMRKSCLPLKSFTLSHSSKSFTWSGLFWFLKTYQFLHYLALEDVEFLSDGQIAVLAKFLTSIRVLKLNRCENLSDSTFYTLIKQCPLLQTLEMKHTSVGIGGIINEEYTSRCRIKTLNLSSSHRMTNKSLRNIALTCPELEKLHLRSCPNISREGVGKFFMNCRDLKHLEIDGCEGVKNLGLDSGNTEKLEFLGASKSGLNDNALIGISRKCPNLMFLNVKNCKALTSKGVMEVVDKCAKLKEINLHGSGVDSSILPRIAFCNRNLMKIKVIQPERSLDNNEESMYRKNGCYVKTQYY